MLGIKLDQAKAGSLMRCPHPHIARKPVRGGEGWEICQYKIITFLGIFEDLLYPKRWSF